jgi:hypothetical protein
MAANIRRLAAPRQAGCSGLCALFSLDIVAATAKEG